MTVELSSAEKLARAVILFHSSNSWTKEQQSMWENLTGSFEATSKVLCDLARTVRSEEENKNSG